MLLANPVDLQNLKAFGCRLISFLFRYLLIFARTAKLKISFENDQHATVAPLVG